MSSIISPFARGISLGAGLTDIKRVEDSVRTGRNGFITAGTQTTQFHFSLILADEAIAAAGLMEVIPFEGRLVGYLTPTILAIFIAMRIDSPCFRDCTIFLENSIGAVCHLAALVSAVALISFGQLAIGITSTAFITVGFLDRQAILPTWISHPFHDYCPILRATASLMVGGLVEKIFAVVSLTMFCYDRYINQMATPDALQANRMAHNKTLDLKVLNQILTGDEKLKLEVNPDHVALEILPPAPAVKIQELTTLFDTIFRDGNPMKKSHILVIRAKFEQDTRFLDLYGNVANYTDEQLIELVKTNLQKYVESVVSQKMEGGVIHDYDRFENYLKTITFQLKKENELIQVDTLLRLAVEGGSYCAPAKFHVAEHLYCQLALKSSTITPEQKVLLRLQDSRTTWFEAEYHKRIQLLQVENSETPQATQDEAGYLFWLLKKSVESKDLHIYHIFLNLYGKKLGLRKASSDNDYAAVVDPLTKLAFKYFTSDIVDEFKKLYTADFICKELQSGAGTSEMPKIDLYTWWKNWVNNQDISPKQKEDLLEEISSAKLLSQPLEIENPQAPLAAPRFNLKFLKAMALDLGILRIKPA